MIRITCVKRIEAEHFTVAQSLATHDGFGPANRFHTPMREDHLHQWLFPKLVMDNDAHRIKSMNVGDSVCVFAKY
jgi:hypothetical protein